MRIEGKIKKINDTDEVIARFGKSVPVGSKVVSHRNRKIGKTSWIFGPVDSPYVEIKLDREQKGFFSMIEKKVYIEVE
ncbi:MAG: hypothetical protein R6U61_06300 [Thermoplasmata archaeon]